MICRFASTYETPLGVRRLSSSTSQRPSSPLIRSLPATWMYWSSGTSMPTTSRRKWRAEHDELARHDPVVEDLLPVVDVVDEVVERPDPLSQTLPRSPPTRRRGRCGESDRTAGSARRPARRRSRR